MDGIINALIYGNSCVVDENQDFYKMYYKYSLPIIVGYISFRLLDITLTRIINKKEVSSDIETPVNTEILSEDDHVSCVDELPLEQKCIQSIYFKPSYPDDIYPDIDNMEDILYKP